MDAQRANHATAIVDFFFSNYITPLERRWRAALDAGLAHGNRTIPVDPEPGAPVVLLFASDASLPIDHIAVYYTTDGAEPVGEHGVVRVGAVALAESLGTDRDDQTGKEVQHWRATLPAQPEGTLVRYRAEGWSFDQITGTGASRASWWADEKDSDDSRIPFGRVFAYSVDYYHPPTWLADAVIYQVFVDRFSAASDEPPLQTDRSIVDFFGGTLNGVRERLDHIKDLGVNCLWLSPIFESPTYHGYDVTDYQHVARRLGGDDALRALVTAAHEHGIRVLLDFAPNHTSHLHPAFLDARENPHSPHFSWYSIDNGRPHGYRSYGDVPSMPQLATDRPEVQRYLNEVSLHWLEEFGIDGFRLDHVGGPTQAFWAILQRTIKERFPDAATIGEISETYEGIASYAGRMDGFMDFPLAGTMRDVFAQRTTPLVELMRALEERDTRLPQGMTPALLLDNHDMHRFLWLGDGDKARLRLAAACQMTLPGTPIIYYGSEVGLSQDDDAYIENAYARAAMLWDEAQDRDLFAHYQRLVALRASHPALRHGELRVAQVSLESGQPDEGGLAQMGAYLRMNGEERLLVALNNNHTPVTLHVAVPEASNAGAIRVLFGEMAPESLSLVDGELRLELPALGAAILAID